MSTNETVADLAAIIGDAAVMQTRFQQMGLHHFAHDLGEMKVAANRVLDNIGTPMLWEPECHGCRRREVPIVPCPACPEDTMLGLCGWLDCHLRHYQRAHPQSIDLMLRHHDEYTASIVRRFIERL